MSPAPPSHDVSRAKKSLRENLRVRLKGVSSQRRRAGGEAIVAHLRPLIDALPDNKKVAFFASRNVEISTEGLDDFLRGAGISRALPTMEGDRLVFRHIPRDKSSRSLPRDAWGIPTPTEDMRPWSLDEIDLLICPALAVNRRGERLGWGRGFYDRILAQMRAMTDPALAVALVLDEQVVSEIPVAPHDLLLDGICTPRLGLVWTPRA
jgi:5-formyltetrahydrofolate cyclo-ligase